MNLIFREMETVDVEDTFSVRSRTRQNPISKERLGSYGITPESTAASIMSGAIKGWVCFDSSSLVGFCSGDSTTGEVLVLAVVPEYEGKGIGAYLLFQVINWLRLIGFDKPWLAASSDSNIRAHGFYRALGWLPNGKALKSGDEILELEPNKMLKPIACKRAPV